MVTNRDTRPQHDPEGHRLEGVLERALTRYHHDELHGGARWIGNRVLDDLLVPIARKAFLDTDDLPNDREVLQTLCSGPMQFLGEGYHMIALLEPDRRFVVKYAKQLHPVPPLETPAPGSQREWEQDHAVAPDGSLHAAIWQHIRAFEAYGPLAVRSRAYIADSSVSELTPHEQRALERFRSIGIVRSLGPKPLALEVSYPESFPTEKRPSRCLTLSVAVVQALVTPLATAIERRVRAGDIPAARELEERYHEFTQQLWRSGVSHLDFSMLNIGLVGNGADERLQIFDPHMGVIDIADGTREVRDPMLTKDGSQERSVDSVLRSSRDGSRWALWRVQQHVATSGDVPQEHAEAAGAIVRDFHAASEGLEQGEGTFGFGRFGRTWRRRRTHVVNTVMHAQLWALVSHPLGALVRCLLDPETAGAVYDRSMAVLGMHGDRPLQQFRARLQVYDHRPLILAVNFEDTESRLVKHWGRVQLPAELDVQDDPAIHYHLRDLFTGETYVRTGDELVRRGLVIGLAPNELHLLQLEDVGVADMAVERTLAVDRDIAPFLQDCTKRVGVVGDVHGELTALEEILLALGFIDARKRWAARDGTLVFTGDIGHGRHLQEVFDFIHRLAGEAHAHDGRIVWTLGNHDLYVDREGGQGGEDSAGYRLWPRIREAALHPERHPGLIVQAAYFAHGKLFVHGGVLPNIVELAARERGSGDAETVADYVNEVLRRTLVDRRRISARDLPHEIFHVGTSHARERRMPGELGYEPAGVFTPDLRELDHYRFHGRLLPQVVGHTASARGEIRYSPGSWVKREYIAIDVGRQHGTGNGGLLLTDFGWVAVTPHGPARLVEVSPFFVELARKAAGARGRDVQDASQVTRMLSTYFQVVRPSEQVPGEVNEALFGDFAPAQIVALEQFLANVRQTGRCVVVTDLDEMLTAFSRGPFEEDNLDVLAAYLGAGGVLVFSSERAFDWFYAQLLRPLIGTLGPHSGLLGGIVPSLSGGRQVFVFEDGAYRLVSLPGAGETPGEVDAPLRLLAGRLHAMPVLDRASTAYIVDSKGLRTIDAAKASEAGIVIDVGDAVSTSADKPITNLHRGYRRAIDVIVAATSALRQSPSTGTPDSPDIGETQLWTFTRPQFSPGRRLRVRVGGSGFVHAGVAHGGGDWNPVYNVPLVPVSNQYEAVLPSAVDAFTFFWTEAPWTPGHPGHWERDRNGPRVFRAIERR